MWRLCLALAACGFPHGVAPGGVDAARDDGSLDAACASAPAWWDSAYSHRFALDVGTAPANYTVQLDATALMSQSLASGSDVRIVAYDNGWAELDRVLSPPAIEFKRPAAGTVWVYVGNATPATPLANAANVFLFAESFNGLALGNNAGARFDPEPSDQWSVIADGASNRVYHAEGAGRHPNAIEGLTLTDGEIRARMRILTGGTQQHDGLAARGTSMVPTTMDGFVGQLQGDSNRIRIAEYVDGVSPPTELVTADRAVARDTWYAMRLRFVGDLVELYVNETRVLMTTRTSNGNLVGLYAHDTVVDYDEVRVRPAIEPEPVITLGGAEMQCP